MLSHFICPILNGDCLGKRCMWFQEYGEQCSIYILAQNVSRRSEEDEE